MNTIKEVLKKNENTEIESSEPFYPPSPTIVNVFVMDKNDTKVTFKDAGESEGSEETMSLVLRSSEDIFGIEEFLGIELAEFYKECKEMEKRIRDHGGWRLTSELLNTIPKMK